MMTPERLAEIEKRSHDRSYLAPLLRDAYEEILRQREVLAKFAMQQPELKMSASQTGNGARAKGRV
jgi:hypothetical protein